MKRSSLIKLQEKVSDSLGLDDFQSKSLGYTLSKHMPAILAENSDELTALLFQKEPRHDKMAEQMLIGRILKYPNIVLPECSGLTPDYFYMRPYRAIFEACQNLNNQSKPIDLDVVAMTIGKDLMDEWGGAQWLESLTLGIKSENTTNQFRERVEKGYKLRILLKGISNALDESFKIDINEADELIEALKASLEVSSVSDNQMKTGADLVDLLESDFQQTLDRIESGVEYHGHLWHIDAMNKISGGKHNGDLVIYAARPGMGKTALMINDINNAVFRLDEVCAFFSLEMPTLNLIKRMFFAEMKVKKSEYNRGLEDDPKRPIHIPGHLKEQFKLFCQKLKKAKCYIDDTPAITWQYVRDKCLAIKNKEGRLDCIYIDYIQLMTALEGFNREQQVSSISRNLKRIAKELGVPIIALSQLNRSVETRGGMKRPQLSDLRESGAIEQDADMVIFGYRPEYYGMFEDEEGNNIKGIMENIWAKNREGPLDTALVFFDAEYTRTVNLSERPDGYSNKTHNHQLGIEDEGDEDSFWKSLKPSEGGPPQLIDLD